MPAAVTADPVSGTVPTGYLLLNVATGTLKRHAGDYVWETQIGGSASARIGFWGATPVVQPSGAAQAAVMLGNTNGEIGGLTISDPPTQAEVEALKHMYSFRCLVCFGGLLIQTCRRTVRRAETIIPGVHL